MSVLTTGVIENAPVAGIRPTTNLAVLVGNNGNAPGFVLIEGYFVSGNAKVLYVQELFSVDPNQVFTKNYFADFDAFEFIFTTGDSGEAITVWGKDNLGNITTAARLVAQELDVLS